MNKIYTESYWKWLLDDKFEAVRPYLFEYYYLGEKCYSQEMVLEKTNINYALNKITTTDPTIAEIYNNLLN